MFRLGLRQGLYCLGCCWAMMLVMFAVGVMNVVWMAALGIIMGLEKIMATTRFSRARRRRVPRDRRGLHRVVGRRALASMRPDGLRSVRGVSSVADAWTIKGDLVLSCNCTVFCPCVLSLGQHAPTEGYCQTWAGIHIEEGHRSDTDLSGIKVGLIARYPRAARARQLDRRACTSTRTPRSRP